MKTIVTFLFVASTLLADDRLTITTTDGQTYKDALIKELRPTGIEVICRSGVLTIPRGKLTKDLQARYYGYGDDELAKHIKQGLDGIYGYREDVMAYAGEAIQLKNDQFTYSTFTDASDPNDHRGPVHGRFAVVGNWLVMSDPKIGDFSRVIVVIDGRTALLTPKFFKQWKDTGRLDKQTEPQYQRKPK